MLINQKGFKLINTNNHTSINKELIHKFSYELLRENVFCPLGFDNENVTIILYDNENYVLKKVQSTLNCEKINIIKEKKNTILRCIDEYYQLDLKKFQNISVNDFLEKLIFHSLSQNTSDIHFCPEKEVLKIKYRIDGVLYVKFTIEKEFWKNLCVRIKIISNIDISETRKSQDGSFVHKCAFRDENFRVATHPTIFGENIVIRRVGDAKTINFDFVQYSNHNHYNVKKYEKLPYGLVLFTGPTGSGKSTSLYSMINALNDESKNIMTLEDPVECVIPGIVQSDIREYPKMNFNLGLRSILRQDPDVILIGEIRDSDTVDMTIRASMTGHKVFSTLHTHDILSSVDRLKELSNHRVLLEQYLKGVISQRLIRCLCNWCKKQRKTSEIEKKLLNCDVVYDCIGCEKCSYTGFFGRVIIAESLLIDDENKELIFSKVPKINKLHQLKEKGFTDIYEDAFQKVRSGITNLQEIKRHIEIGD